MMIFEGIVAFIVLAAALSSLIIRFNGNEPLIQTILAGTLVVSHTIQLTVFDFNWFTFGALVVWVLLLIVDGRRLLNIRRL